jgi:beta-lactamase class D
MNYGEMHVDSSNIDVFWLEGDSRISQYEQVDFLYRFYYDRLALSPRTTDIMKRLMIIEETPSYRLSGKTGWSVREGRNNGWFVGYVETGDNVYFFATNINPGVDFNLELFLVIRRDITMKAFRSLDIF